MTTNYHRHFGDPARAAEALDATNACLKAFADCGDPDACDGCPLMLAGGACGSSVGKWAEWLESEAEERHSGK